MSYDGIVFLENPCGDLAIEDGDLVRVTGADAIRQLWLARVKTYKGEWILDANRGVPYVQEIFQKTPSERRIEEIYRDITLGTPGVLSIVSIEIGDIDPVERHVEITVEAIIDGPEGITFNYDGSLAKGACSLPTAANLPLTIEGLRAWFDAQDLGNLTYNSPLNMQNKAGAGYAEGDVTLEGVSALGNKRSVFFDNDLTQTKELDILDTPAIRHGDGSMSVFIVLKQATKTSYSAGESYGLLSLDGYDVTTGKHEFYNFSIYMERPLTPDSAQIQMESGRVNWFKEHAWMLAVFLDDSTSEYLQDYSPEKRIGVNTGATHLPGDGGCTFTGTANIEFANDTNLQSTNLTLNVHGDFDDTLSFEENFIDDASVIANGGTLYNNPTINNGVELNGINQYITYSVGTKLDTSIISFVVDFTPDFTLGDGNFHYWYDSAGTGRTMLYMDTTGGLVAYRGGSAAVSASSTVVTSNWNALDRNNIIVTCESGASTMCLNGVEIAASTDVFTVGLIPTLYVGCRYTVANFFDGTIHRLVTCECRGSGTEVDKGTNYKLKHYLQSYLEFNGSTIAHVFDNNESITVVAESGEKPLFYVDNVYIGEGDITTANPTDSTDLTIGNNAALTAPTPYAIKKVLITDELLTQDELPDAYDLTAVHDETEISRTVTTIPNLDSQILQFDIDATGKTTMYLNGVLVGGS